MKITFKYILSLSIPLFILISGCSKKLEEAYLNPNATVRVPVETLLPGIIGNFFGSSSAAGSAYGLAADALLIGRYVQYWGTYSTGVTATSGPIYDMMGGSIGTSDNLGSIWASHYYGMGQNVNRMIEWGTEEQKWDYVGAGWAARAWSMFEATNEYSDIILKQAFNTSLQTFQYEGQPEVYDSVRAVCHRSLAFLSRTDGNVNQANFAKGDAYFNGGDVNKWKKFVYGILARSYAYISNKPAYSADSVIKYADLAMGINADNATLKFANTGISGTSNYFGPLRANAGTIRQSAFIADLMSGANNFAFSGVADPRAWYLLRENSAGRFKGIIPWRGASGLQASELPTNFWGNTFNSTTAPTTDQGRYLFRNGVEVPIMTASEMQFLKAEAAYRKNDKATALSAYTRAISLNFEMLATTYGFNVPAGRQITTAVTNDFLSNPAIVPTSANDLTLTHIMLQKYIALYGWGVQETWVDMRRFHYNEDKDPTTGQPVYAGFIPPAGAEIYTNNNNKLVYRARPRYNSEYLYNIPELKRIGALELDYHTLKPWFAQ